MPKRCEYRQGFGLVVKARMGELDMIGIAKTQRRDKGCRGVKAVRGVDRGTMAALQSRRKKICRACDEKGWCFIAHCGRPGVP